MTCFAASNYQAIFHEYRRISRYNPGWTLSEIRRMSVRERHYWADVADTLREAIFSE